MKKNLTLSQTFIFKPKNATIYLRKSNKFPVFDTTLSTRLLKVRSKMTIINAHCLWGQKKGGTSSLKLRLRLEVPPLTPPPPQPKKRVLRRRLVLIFLNLRNLYCLSCLYINTIFSAERGFSIGVCLS